jgi:hypothetical protein
MSATSSKNSVFLAREAVVTRALSTALAKRAGLRASDAETGLVTFTDFLAGVRQATVAASAVAIKRTQGCFGGPGAAAAEWLQGVVDAGARHITVRLVGDPQRQMDALARLRESLAA